MSSINSGADVVVAGAGPVGLVAALALADAGVQVLVLEKRASLNTASKASTFHPSTLEVLDVLGLMHDIRQQGEIELRLARLDGCLQFTF